MHIQKKNGLLHWRESSQKSARHMFREEDWLEEHVCGPTFFFLCCIQSEKSSVSVILAHWLEIALLSLKCLTNVTAVATQKHNCTENIWHWKAIVSTDKDWLEFSIVITVICQYCWFSVRSRSSTKNKNLGKAAIVGYSAPMISTLLLPVLAFRDLRECVYVSGCLGTPTIHLNGQLLQWSEKAMLGATQT